MTARTRRRLEIAVLASGLLAFTFANGTGGAGIYAQQGGKQPPSKVASIIRDRIDRIAAIRAATGALTPVAATGLSSETLIVTPNGELEVEFHAGGPVDASHSAALVGFGATILASTGDIQCHPAAAAGYDRRQNTRSANRGGRESAMGRGGHSGGAATA